MAPVTTRHARHHEPRLVRGPALFGGSRKAVAELVGLVWLAVELTRLVRRHARHRVAAGT